MAKGIDVTVTDPAGKDIGGFFYRKGQSFQVDADELKRVLKEGWCVESRYYRPDPPKVEEKTDETKTDQKTDTKADDKKDGK